MEKYHLSELDYFFKSYWQNYGSMTQYKINFSESQEPVGYSDLSVFSLLFNNVFYETEYIKKFRELDMSFSELSVSLRDRLRGSSNIIRSFVVDTSGSDILFNDYEMTYMLDRLLEYRVYGTLLYALDVQFDELDNNLSKLIYIYLDLMINDNFKAIEDYLPLSDSTVIIENLFELYVLNEAYRKELNSEFFESNNVTIIIPVRDRTVVTNEILAEKQFLLSKYVMPECELDLYHNGIEVDDIYYRIIDTTGPGGDILDTTGGTSIISWKYQVLGSFLKVNDILITDYYTTLYGDD